jgi:hypothetical protein
MSHSLQWFLFFVLHLFFLPLGSREKAIGQIWVAALTSKKCCINRDIVHNCTRLQLQHDTPKWTDKFWRRNMAFDWPSQHAFISCRLISLYSSVGIVSTLGFNNSETVVPFPARTRNLPLPWKVQSGSEAHLAQYSENGFRSPVAGSKAAEAWGWQLTSIYCWG